MIIKRMTYIKNLCTFFSTALCALFPRSKSRMLNRIENHLFSKGSRAILTKLICTSKPRRKKTLSEKRSKLYCHSITNRSNRLIFFSFIAYTLRYTHFSKQHHSVVYFETFWNFLEIKYHKRSFKGAFKLNHMTGHRIRDFRYISIKSFSF